MNPMNQEQLKTAQRAQLIIAKEIRRICLKHDIKYTLVFGSMIGAVRHRGFIPWDDDLDMAMERKEYDRFVECCKEDLNDAFTLQTCETDPDYLWTFLKIRMNGTLFRSEWDNETNVEGVWVDIFPVEKAPRSASKLKRMNIRYKAMLRALHIKKGMTGYLENGAAKKLLRSLLKFYGSFYSARRLMEKITKLTTRYSYDHSYESDALFCNDALYNRLSRDVFDHYVEMPFEGENFLLVSGYDRWLRQEYGDYMQFPPEEERENHHNISEFSIPEALLDEVEASLTET